MPAESTGPPRAPAFFGVIVRNARFSLRAFGFRLPSLVSVDNDFSRFVAKFETGDRSSLDETMAVVYAELRRMAGHYMSGERPGHTLQATALLHEAYLRVVCQHSVEWTNRVELLAIFARMMRRVLLDHIDSRQAAKRGGGLVRITLTDQCALDASGSIDLFDLDRALRRLQEIDSQQAEMVELRFFGGMNDEEIGSVLAISPATVRRRWASARLWLAHSLAAEGKDSIGPLA